MSLAVPGPSTDHQHTKRLDDDLGRPGLLPWRVKVAKSLPNPVRPYALWTGSSPFGVIDAGMV